MTIRIVLADDHPIVRDGLVSVLETQPDFEIVGQASNGEEAVDLVARLHPDVILLDLEMPGLDGVQALQAMRAAHTHVRALIFTAFDTDERIFGALQAGAHGYLLKGVPREELFSAIRVVAQGGSTLQPVIAARLVEHVAGPSADALTDREREVLDFMARGLQNKEIAQALGIGERTVKFHVSAILAKLGAGNRTEAVRMAVRRGLVRLS